MTSLSMSTKVKAIRKKRLNSPNDHIIIHIKQWYNDAKANGAQTVHCYRKALNSIEKYPLRLETGSDCKILYGFGEKICDAIDEKLNIKQTKTMSMSNFDQQKHSSNNFIDFNDNDNQSSSTKQIQLNINTKKNTRTIKKTTSASPKLFSNLTSSNKQSTTISTLLAIIDTPVKLDSIPLTSFQTWKPGSFHIKLCIDNAEASRSTQKVLLEHLKKNSIEYDIRKLNIGDFLWLVQPNDTTIKCEAILDYIVERKRLDDLSKSIIDGRYNEQKFRLKQCGITNLIYLVENLKNTNHPGILTPAALNQAIINTQVVEQFFVREVSNSIEMVNYLIAMTKHLINHFQNKTLHILNDNDMSNNYKISYHDPEHYLMTFQSFNSGIVKSKPPTVKEMFARSLMQISGMSIDNILALTQIYPTPAKLIEAYNQCSNDQQRKLMLSSIKKLTSNRKLGKVLSTTIEMLFNNASYS